jgi:hypothetical protein
MTCRSSMLAMNQSFPPQLPAPPDDQRAGESGLVFHLRLVLRSSRPLE